MTFRGTAMRERAQAAFDTGLDTDLDTFWPAPRAVQSCLTLRRSLLR